MEFRGAGVRAPASRTTSRPVTLSAFFRPLWPLAACALSLGACSETLSCPDGASVDLETGECQFTCGDGIVGGDEICVFDTALGRIGVCICYDSEFPLIARAMVEAGAQILLVPSCTDTLHGYHRVRIGAQARALEGQCYTVQSPTVGTAAWSPAVDVNRGVAAIYGPPDRGFPASGVVAEGVLDQPGWVFGEADLAAIAAVRKDGGVLNLAHWAEQPGGERALGGPVTHVSLA